MDKITKNLERALSALQLANNEIERLKILKREITQKSPQGELLGEICSQINKLEETITPVG